MNDPTEEVLDPATHDPAIDDPAVTTESAPGRSVVLPSLRTMAGPLVGVALVSLGIGFLLARNVGEQSSNAGLTSNTVTTPGPTAATVARLTTTPVGGSPSLQATTTFVATSSSVTSSTSAPAPATTGRPASTGAATSPATSTADTADTTSATTAGAGTTVAVAGTTAVTTPPPATTAAPVTTRPAPTTTSPAPTTTRPAPTTLPLGPYAALVNSARPVGYWHLDEPSGGTARDASGGGRTGVYAGGFFTDQAGALARGVGRAVRFESGAVEVADSPALRLNGAFTIELWARMTSFQNTWPGLVVKGAAASADGYLVRYDASGRVILKRNDVEVASAPGALRTDRFTHLAVTYDGTTVRWYVDGAASGSRSVSFPPNNGSALLSIGKGDQYGDHTIDEVAFYDTALPPSTLGAHVDAARS